MDEITSLSCENLETFLKDISYSLFHNYANLDRRIITKDMIIYTDSRYTIKKIGKSDETIPKIMNSLHDVIIELLVEKDINYSVDLIYLRFSKIIDDMNNDNIDFCIDPYEFYVYFNGILLNPDTINCFKKQNFLILPVNLPDFSFINTFENYNNIRVPKKYRPNNRFFFIASNRIRAFDAQIVFKHGHTIIAKFENELQVPYIIDHSISKSELYKKYGKNIYILRQQFLNIPRNLYVNDFTKRFFNDFVKIAYKDKVFENFFTKEYSFVGLPLLPNFSLFEHQLQTIFYMKSQEATSEYGIHGGIISLEMGLGKTLIALAYCLLKNNKPNLIICSKTLLAEWKFTINKFFYPNTIKYLIFHKDYSNIDIKHEDLYKYDLVITTYDLCSMGYESEKSPYNKLFKVEWERIIADESQRISNPGTISFKAAKKLRSKFKWCMTGTPIRNSSIDLWTQFNFIGFEEVNEKFWKKHGLEYYREHNMDMIVFKMDYKEAKITLPPKIENSVYIPFSEPELLVYRAIIKDILERLNELEALHEKNAEIDPNLYRSILTIFMRLRQFCVMPYSIRKYVYDDWMQNRESESLEKCAKFNKVAEIMSAIPKDEKVIIFSSFVEPLIELSKFITKTFKIKTSVITGDSEMLERESVITNFRTNPEQRVLLMTYKVGSEGLTIVEANNCICLEPWWNITVKKQAVARCWRIGQIRQVNVYNLFIEGSMEVQIEKLCIEKNKITKNFLEGEEHETQKISFDFQTLRKILS